MTVTHAFVSAIADSTDSTLVRPSNWNADHTISGTSGTVQYNNSGSLSGITNLASNGTNVTSLRIEQTNSLDWQSSSTSSGIDLSFSRQGVGVSGLSNGTGAASFRVYNTLDSVTSPTNYERGFLDWNTYPNVFAVGSQWGGTGTGRNVAVVAGNSINMGITPVGAVIIGGNMNSSFTNGNITINNDNGYIVSWNGSLLGWSSAGSVAHNSNPDTALARTSAQIIEINNGTAGTGPGMLRLCGATVSQLSTSVNAGTLAYVTDGVSGAAWGSSVTGSSSTKYVVWFNGSAWTVFGK